MKGPTLIDDLTEVLNKHSAEQLNNTLDFILAKFLITVLTAYTVARMDTDNYNKSPLAAPLESFSSIFAPSIYNMILKSNPPKLK